MKFIYFVALIVCLMLVAVGIRRMFEKADFTLEQSGYFTATDSTSSQDIPNRVKNMTLEEKIGQMMMAGFENPFADDHIRKMITEYHIGGVNLLRRNVGSLAEIIQMNSDLKEISAGVTDIPFIIGVDQEGGSYSRFKFIVHQKSQMEFKDTAEAYDESYERGKELKALGITTIFGPVVDYVTDKRSYLYSRSFGGRFDDIVPLSEAMIKGYEDAGIRAVIKHFPGYGNVLNDPHRNPAKIESRVYYEKSTIPFQKLMEGRGNIAVMTAHVITTGSEGLPATYSSRLLKNVIRDRWAFEGVIMTDDLEMISAGKNISVPELAVKAIQAGNDMIMSTFTIGLHAQIHNAIVEAVQDGRISEEQVNDSVEKILRWKGYGTR